MSDKVSQTTFDGQHEDEDILMVFRRHPIVMRKGLWILLILVLIGAIPSLIWPVYSSLWYLFGGLVLGCFVLFYWWIGWFYSVFIVSDQRLIQISQQGLFNRAVVDVGLDKIQNINFQVGGLTETLLGFGTIVIQTFVGDLVIEDVHHPQRIQESLVKIIKNQGYTSYIGTQVKE